MIATIALLYLIGILCLILIGISFLPFNFVSIKKQEGRREPIGEPKGINTVPINKKKDSGQNDSIDKENKKQEEVLNKDIGQNDSIDKQNEKQEKVLNKNGHLKLDPSIPKVPENEQAGNGKGKKLREMSELF